MAVTITGKFTITSPVTSQEICDVWGVSDSDEAFILEAEALTNEFKQLLGLDILELAENADCDFKVQVTDSE